MNQPHYGIQLDGKYTGITNPRELSEVSDWLIDYVEYHGWLTAGSPESSMIYHPTNDLTLANLKRFERMFRNRWPLFDGHVSLQDLEACTLAEWDEIRALIRQINEA